LGNWRTMPKLSLSARGHRRLRPRPAGGRQEAALSATTAASVSAVSLQTALQGARLKLRAHLAAKEMDAAVPGRHAHLEDCPACSGEHESLLTLVAEERR
jgi:hypothetical protein